MNNEDVTVHRRKLGRESGRVPSLIEKRPRIHQLLPPFLQLFLFSPNIFVFSQYFGFPTIFSQVYPNVTVGDGNEAKDLDAHA